MICLYLFITALLLPFAGAQGMVWRVVSLQICTPLLAMTCLIYIWNFGREDKTFDRVKGKRFSSLKPQTQRVLRIILKWSGLTVIGLFLATILPFEIKASRLLLLGESDWIRARIVSDDSPLKGRIFLQRVNVQTSNGEALQLEFFLPGDGVRISGWRSFELLSGTDYVVCTR